MDKKCSSCKQLKPSIEFIHNDKELKTCNSCSEYKATYYQQNKEAMKESMKEYYKQNKEAMKERNKEYHQQNKDAIKEYYQQQKLENPLHVKFINMISHSKTYDKKNGLLYEDEDYITIEFLNELFCLQQGKCFYQDCEVELTLDFIKETRPPTQITIQRHNNLLAHIQTNCCLSCFKCNHSHKERTK